MEATETRSPALPVTVAIERLRALGFEVEDTEDGQFRIVAPAGWTVTVRSPWHVLKLLAEHDG